MTISYSVSEMKTKVKRVNLSSEKTSGFKQLRLLEHSLEKSFASFITAINQFCYSINMMIPYKTELHTKKFPLG
jgi:hypothetical protein